MPVLHRQAIGPEAGRRVPERVPETKPTPLQRHYINLSAIVLVAGAVAITALEANASMHSPIVKLCVLVGTPIFVATTADAALRFYRSAMAWLPINRGRGLFRLTWVVAALLGIGVVVGFALQILFA